MKKITTFKQWQWDKLNIFKKIWFCIQAFVFIIGFCGAFIIDWSNGFFKKPKLNKNH